MIIDCKAHKKAPWHKKQGARSICHTHIKTGASLYSISSLHTYQHVHNVYVYTYYQVNVYTRVSCTVYVYAWCFFPLLSSDRALVSVLLFCHVICRNVSAFLLLLLIICVWKYIAYVYLLHSVFSNICTEEEEWLQYVYLYTLCVCIALLKGKEMFYDQMIYDPMMESDRHD